MPTRIGSSHVVVVSLETIPNVASEIVVAVISGGVLIGAALIAAVIAPWAKVQFEERGPSRKLRIEDWRQGVKKLRRDERQYGKEQPRARAVEGKYLPEIANEMPDPDLVNVYTKPWFRTLKPNLSFKTRWEIRQLNRQPVKGRIGVIPNRLGDAIDGIARKWKLV